MAFDITLSVPDHLHEMLELHRRTRSLASEETVLDLIWRALAQEELERQLLDGINDESRQLSDADWDAKRRDLLDRFSRLE